MVMSWHHSVEKMISSSLKDPESSVRLMFLTPQSRRKVSSAQNVSLTSIFVLCLCLIANTATASDREFSRADFIVIDRYQVTEAYREGWRKPNTRFVKRVLGGKSSLDSVDKDGRSALLYSTYYQNTLVLESLISMGADIDLPNGYGTTPLIMACVNRNTAAIKNLLDAGANASLLNNFGRNCLHISVRNSDALLAQELIDSGIDVNSVGTDPEHETALSFAAHTGDAAIVKILLKAGADPNLTPLAVDYTPLHFAAGSGSLETVKAIVERGADLSALTPDPQNIATPIEIAYGNGHASIVEYLIRQSPKHMGESVSRSTWPILHRFALQGDSKAIANAVAYGANPNQRREGDGVTPIFAALSSGHLDAVNALVAAGADPEAKATGGNTPLIAASIKGQTEIAKQLLNLGVDVNAVNDDGNTALLLAYYQLQAVEILAPVTHKTAADYLELVESLKSSGASIDISNSDGVTARQIEAEEAAKRQKVSPSQSSPSESGGGFNWAKAAAITVGVLAGGAESLPAEAQAELLVGIVQDGFSDDMSISGTEAALNSSIERIQADNRQTQDLAATSQQSSVKDHYLDIRNRGGSTGVTRSCDHPSPQINSFCTLGNQYYDIYLSAVEQNQPNQREMYDRHRKTINDMLAMMRTHKTRASLPVSEGSDVTRNSSRDSSSAISPTVPNSEDLPPCEPRPGVSCAVPQ